MSKPDKREETKAAETRPPATPMKRWQWSWVAVNSDIRWMWRHERAWFLFIVYEFYIPIYMLIAPCFLWLLSLNSNFSKFDTNTGEVNELLSYSPRILLFLMPASFLLWAWRDDNKREEISLETERKRTDDFAWIVQYIESESDYYKIAAIHAVEAYLKIGYDSHYEKTARKILLDGHRTDVQNFAQHAEIKPKDIAESSVMHARNQIIKNNFARIVEIEKDFSHGNFSGLDLQGIIALRCDFMNAIFINTGLQKANLQRANLRGATLQGAKLWRAKLQNTKLQWADLQDADLTGADLTGADLTGADLTGATYSKEQLLKTKSYRGVTFNPEMDNPPPDEREPSDEDSE